MAPEKERIQINIRLRASTKAALEQSAEEDLRSMAEQADILICEALETRAARAERKHVPLSRDEVLEALAARLTKGELSALMETIDNVERRRADHEKQERSKGKGKRQ